MKVIEQAVEMQIGLAFALEGAALEIDGGKGRWARESALLEEKVRKLEEMLEA